MAKKKRKAKSREKRARGKKSGSKPSALRSPPVNARRRGAIAAFLARTQETQKLCGECGKPVGPAGALYRRCPVTGRQTAAAWCDDCYEKAVLADTRERSQRRERQVALRKVA